MEIFNRSVFHEIYHLESFNLVYYFILSLSIHITISHIISHIPSPIQKLQQNVPFIFYDFLFSHVWNGDRLLPIKNWINKHCWNDFGENGCSKCNKIWKWGYKESNVFNNERTVAIMELISHMLSCPVMTVDIIVIWLPLDE